jgi:hypothetical protein
MAILHDAQYWENHYSIVFPPPGITREPMAGRKLPIQVKEQTELDFEKLLTEYSEESKMFRFRIPDMNPVHFTMHAFGKTSLVVRWYRLIDKSFDDEALTLCLGGSDPAKDETAISYAFDTVLGQYIGADSAKLYADSLQKEPRPAGVRVHYDVTSYDDQALRVCSTCLAVAFFG